MKSINLLSGEADNLPKSLSIIPYPSMGLKALIKSMVIVDKSRRGGAVDSALILIFNESNDSIFYKYMKHFEGIFEKSAAKIIEIEEAKADKQQINEELERFYNIVLETLNDLRASEMALEDSKEFPAEEAEEAGKKVRTFKIVVCGDAAVGKTSTVLRFTDKTFRRTYVMTMGVNISEKIFRYNNITFKFVIWDIAGQSKFQTMRKYFYSGANGQLLIFDLTRPNTFQSIRKWFADIKLHIKEDMHGILLGNKCDLIDARKIFKEEILKLANELNLEYIETSALTGENVDEAFYKLGVLLNKILEAKSN